MRSALFVLIVVLAVALLGFLARPEAMPALGKIDDWSLSLRIFIGCLIVGILLASFRQRLTHAIASILVWGSIVVVLAVGYTYRFDLRDVADRVMAELLPGRAATRGRLVEIVRTGNNFPVLAQVNGAHVAMLLDTGATSVVLTQEAARSAGLPLEVLAYTVSVETANGRTRAAPVTIDAITIGGITERAVPALIAQPGQLQTNLLGMSFLNRLQSWEVRGDKLMLRGK
ncbi:MAG TPA: TIGR02281 family clan AA aspartic protease [Xanthobacteraceae bacterium]|nr:TIGR02281 family clan AA aspartic protease [Xanthobacteraceae bacterium]